MAKYKENCSSQDPQVPLLQARVIELEENIKDIKEKQASEMKEMKEQQTSEMKEKQTGEMKERQEYMLQSMATIKEHIPNLDFSNVLNEDHKDSCSAYVNPRPTSSRASQNHTSGS